MSRMRILLATEEGKTAQKLYRALTQEHYEIDTAADDYNSKILFDSRKYAIVIIVQPFQDKDGQYLCNYFRESNNNIPVIVISSTGMANKNEVLDAGADDYLTLSDDTRELVSHIRVLINRPSRSFFSGSTLEAGDIMLNVESKEVMRASRLVMTTAKEFVLLEFLVRNKNRVVSRAEMLTSIWGNQFYLNEVSLTTCMNTLRRKLEYANLPKRIYTVTGRGYLLL